ncbi:quinone oxidoreductase family protein [Arthrobacter sp. NPDC056691]|uniref:quinone oxidoreductase family protein n=1 Tax=Arthrobacter sp. NPDC056691 TaxID=3345913 RepID=UPI003671B8A6
MINAIVARQPGGPEVLVMQEIEEPVLRPGQILVRVAAAGVNFIDTRQRSGIYSCDFPFTPGLEVAGTVISVGDDVQNFSVGDRVATAECVAGYAEFALIEQEKAWAVPAEVDDLTAAAIPLQGLTAHYLVNSSFRVEPGQTAVVHAGAGGVGLLLTQLLKARGARVISTVSTDEKETLAKLAGADAVLRYEGFADRVRELTGGVGADVGFDGVGGTTFEGSLASLRIRGTLVLFGASSGQVSPVDMEKLAAGSFYLTRPTSQDFIRDKDERLWRSSELFSAVAEGSLKVRIGQTYPLVEAANAHRDLEGRKTTGKILLVP